MTVLDAVITVEARTIGGWIDAIRRLRQTRYDIALDFQGLMKSAVFARASGARRVAGFSIWHLREKTARPLYSETGEAPEDEDEHVIRKNLHLLRVLGVAASRIEFPLAHAPSPAADAVARDLQGQRFAMINPHCRWFFEETKADGTKVTWEMSGAGPQALRAAGLVRIFQIGQPYEVTFAPAKNGANVGRVRTMKGPDGKVITLFHEDPTNPLNN